MMKRITPLLLSLLLLSGCTGLGTGKSEFKIMAAEHHRPVSEVILSDSPSKPGEAAAATSDTGKLDPKKPDSSYTLVVSGDAMSHENSWRSALQEDGSFDYMPQYQEVSHLLDTGDLTLVNLETPVSGEEYGYSGFPKFNAPLNLAETLKAVGVDMVITANNHVLDYGLEGMEKFLDNLENVGLLHTGAARSPEEAAAPYILDINGIRTGFAASTAKVTMEIPVDYAVKTNRKEVIQRQIRDLREAGAELIVYHIHWGKEYTEYPSDVQLNLYRILSEEGVDVVIGSHPHRLQPMEIRQIEFEGAMKNQAVIWSTANFSWGGTQRYDYVNTGAVFQIRVERKNNEITIADMDYDLVYNLNTETIDDVKYIKLIPETDKELYRESHPEEYAKMVREFEWAHETLSKSVEVPFPADK